ncbi:nucleotide disphospho-sugar-binding domain-containing protein [Streptosporangium carneum]|uniref:Glycosyl transferase n=1 Tax=Streptosporangium carneum TaxID=47481 RepID=A0A9W6MHF5_9ACTN|nr:nucleotide disphospho-sugar-binding domain-containing protein [Streptosporangium carneum]GLK14799.1 glycosyl transferase [Streptosporangium carneum]
MVPLAWAFRLAGHEVTVVTGGDGLAARDAGLVTLDAVPGLTTARMVADFLRDRPELLESMHDLSAEEMRKRMPLAISMWDGYVDEHVRIAERLRPDLVVYDPIFTAGPVAAARLGVPCVAHNFGMARFEPEMFREPPADAAFHRNGVAVPDRIETIDVAPPSLLEGTPSRWTMRYVPYNGGGVLPEWLLDPGDRPRVAITLGTVVPETHGLGEFERIIAAAGEVDAQFVVAVGNKDLSELGELPPNVRATGWVPLGALLRHCVAAVHHGGAGTALTCSALGVPQLILPNGADRHLNADALSARGSALSARIEELDASLIDVLLTDEGLRSAAGEVRNEIESLPTPAELVPELVKL